MNETETPEEKPKPKHPTRSKFPKLPLIVRWLSDKLHAADARGVVHRKIEKNSKTKKRHEKLAAAKASRVAQTAPKPGKRLHSPQRGTSNSRTARKAVRWPDGTVEAGS